MKYSLFVGEKKDNNPSILCLPTSSRQRANIYILLIFTSEAAFFDRQAPVRPTAPSGSSKTSQLA
jgi:hypothetical protein